MRSYASVEEGYGNLIKCEVENCDVSERREGEIVFDCFDAYISGDLFRQKGYYPVAGDIFSVIHENGVVTEVCEFEPDEKARRVRLLMSIMGEE